MFIPEHLNLFNKNSSIFVFKNYKTAFKITKRYTYFKNKSETIKKTE